MRKSKKTSTISVHVGRQYIICSECSLEELEVPSNVSKVVCANCVQKMTAPPEGVKPKSDKPRGWHLKMYFEHNGEVYSKGILVTDPQEIKKLKKNVS